MHACTFGASSYFLGDEEIFRAMKYNTWLLTFAGLYTMGVLVFKALLLELLV